MVSPCVHSAVPNCPYAQPYTHAKPLTHVYIESLSVHLVEDQSLDDQGHCCGKHVNGAPSGAQYAVFAMQLA